MRNIVVTALFLAAAASVPSLAAAAPTHGGEPGVNSSVPPSALQVAQGGLVNVIKGATLNGYRGEKVGDAFDRYSHFKVKEWREARGTAGTIYVDFYGYVPTGLLDVKARLNGVSSKGVMIKFVIYPNGEYGIVMASKTVVMKDGKSSITPIPDIKGVVDAIYRNKKLDL